MNEAFELFSKWTTLKQLTVRARFYVARAADSEGLPLARADEYLRAEFQRLMDEKVGAAFEEVRMDVKLECQEDALSVRHLGLLVYKFTGVRGENGMPVVEGVGMEV